MAINGPAYFERKQRQYRVQNSHSNFRNDYLMALNDALAELGAALDSDFGGIGDVDADVPVSPIQAVALGWLMDAHLITMGHKSGDLTAESADRFAQRAITRAGNARDMASTSDATNQSTVGFFTANE